jgi:hypothetical protein
MEGIGRSLSSDTVRPLLGGAEENYEVSVRIASL